MKKIRVELTEYWYDEVSGRIVVKKEEKRLISEKNGEERWENTNSTVPIV